MSDTLQPNADYLDDNTHKIVTGYIRRCHQIIPMDIITLLLRKIDDHFMLNRGSFKWVINVSKLKQKERFDSKSFEIGKLKWSLRARPKGDDIWKIYLSLKRLPKPWKSIITSTQISCIETNAGYHSIDTFIKSKQGFGPNNFISINEIKNMHQLTINLVINILRINGNNDEMIYQSSPNIDNFIGTKHIKWRINGELMKQMKNARVNKFFMSPVYGNTWCFRMQPNTDDSKGYIELNICTFPKGMDQLDVSVRFICDDLEMDVMVHGPIVFDTKDYGNGIDAFDGDKATFESFQEMDEIIIFAEIYVHDIGAIYKWKELVECREFRTDAEVKRPRNLEGGESNIECVDGRDIDCEMKFEEIHKKLDYIQQHCFVVEKTYFYLFIFILVAIVIQLMIVLG